MEEHEFSQADVRAALESVVASGEFARSPQLIEFLRYIVEATLAGESDRLKAYSIAVDVFGRPADFDPQIDSIVRVQAGRLRKLLHDVYEKNAKDVKVRILLPTGRYVPRFEANIPSAARKRETRDAGRMPSGRAGASTGLAWYVWPLMILAGVVVLFGFFYGSHTLLHLLETPHEHEAETAAGVGIALGLSEPIVIIDGFSQLDDSPLSASAANVLPQRLADHLFSFESVQVRMGEQTEDVAGTDAGAFIFQLSGTVLDVDGRLEVSPLLVRADTQEVVWTTTLSVVHGDPSVFGAIEDISLVMAAEIGGLRGSIHRALFALLPDHAEALSDEVSTYVCRLYHERAMGLDNVEAAVLAEACFARVLARHPSDSIARAALTALHFQRALRTASLKDNLAEAMFDELNAVNDAVVFLPRDSFVHEQYARILRAAGFIEAAQREFETAILLNPGNANAHAGLGLLLVLNGQFEEGRKAAETALGLTSVPAPWYYAALALDYLQAGDDEPASQAALALEPDDTELASVVLVAAAYGRGRPDLIELFMPRMLAHAPFQAQGIMPRLAVRIGDAELLGGLRTGLEDAGVDARYLEGPYDLPDSLSAGE